MITELLQAVFQAGGYITAADGNLVLEAAKPLPEELIALLKKHKIGLMAALLHKADAEDLRECFEELAGILEYDVGLPKPEAETEAAKITAALARNRYYLWTSLRAAFADYPVLLAQVPDKPGFVDSLPLGIAKIVVLPNRRVTRGRSPV